MIEIIEDLKHLKEFCKESRKSKYLAIDTEFIRRNTYKSVLCLIQVNNGNKCVAIDPFAIKNLDPFFKLINNTPKIVKIFHASRQDLEIFFDYSKKLPSNIFDTQVAATVCGFPESIGYGKLVSIICKKDLDKEYQYSDWDKRPLDKKQIKYAIKDVEYLPEIYFSLDKQIQKSGRKDWIKDEVNILKNKHTYIPNPDECWRKIKTRAKTPRYLAILKELASTREKIAIKNDIPKTFILSDDKLLKLSLLENPTVKDLQSKYKLSEDVAKKFVIALKKGIKTKEKDYPSINRRKKCNSSLEYMLKLVLTMVSEDLKVASSLIASADDIADLASTSTEKNNPCLHGWRYEVFGKYLEDIQNGHIKIGLDKNCKMKIFRD